MSAIQNRQAAIDTLISNWIETQDPQCMGALISGDSWHDLATEVQMLRRLSRSEKWNAAVDKFAAYVEQMFNIFCTQEFELDIEQDKAEVSKLWGQGVDAYTATTRREFARLIKHTVWQGAFYVYGN